MPSRRSVLVGLGGLVAGGGALIGTGAFTTVEAERTVNVQTAGDASAFLGLEPANRGGNPNNPFVEQNNNTVEITLENPNGNNGANATGLNENAKTIFRELVTITNNGTQEVTSLTLEFINDGSLPGSITESNLDSIFSFTVSPSGNNNSQSTVDNGDDILNDTDSYYSGNLTPGEAVNFGIEVDLLDSGVTELPGGGSYTLEITAETDNSNNTS